MRIAFTALLGCLLAAAPALAQDASPLKSDEDKVSYSIGLSVGRNLKTQDIEVKPDKFILGLRDGMKGGKLLMTDDEIRDVMIAYQMQRRAKQVEDMRKTAEANRKTGQDFLAANKKKKGVKSTASGLQYQVLREGKGTPPVPTSVVTAHYKGTLINGTEFDSSYSRGEPAQFPVNGVIAGWQEVLQLMPPGSKWMVWIPSDLAYGEQGAGKQIEPNSVLIFEIELISFE